MVSATRSASSSGAWPSQSEEQSQEVEAKLPAGAVVGDVTKEAGMEELLRQSRGGGGGLRIHKRCHGCGAWLHSNDPEEHGYVPEEAREKFSLTGSRLKFLSQPPLLGSTSERPKAGGRFEQLRRA